MPIKVVEGSMNVLDAAITRVRNVFKNDCKIYLSFSSGKDSLCMASIVYDLIRAGEIDGTKLTVTFIDEEGLYPPWSKRHTAGGATSCLPAQNSCGFVCRSSRCRSSTIFRARNHG